MKKPFLTTGVLFLGLVIALGAIGIGQALWSETLTIDGSVHTGTVDVYLSDDGTQKCVDIVGVGLCQQIPEGKDVATCETLYAGPDGDSNVDEGADHLQITVTGAYPSFHCKVSFDIGNIGTVPVHVTMTGPTGNAAVIESLVCAPTFVAVDYIQLHAGGEILCTLDLHFSNDDGLDENTTYTFQYTFLAKQWNE
jgi:hypothetical protein